MNRKLKLIALGLVLTSFTAVNNNANANCVGSGFGIGLSGVFQYLNAKIDPANLKNKKSAKEKEAIAKLKAAGAAFIKKLETKNTGATQTKESGTPWTWNGYTQADIPNASNDKTMPKVTTFTTKFNQFESENPTKYRVVTPAVQYDANGFATNDNTGSKDTIVVQAAPGFLAQNNLQWDQNYNANADTKTNNVNNYAPLQDTTNNNEKIRVTPYDYWRMNEINKSLDAAPVTHMLVTDADPSVANFLTAVYNNDPTSNDKYGFFKSPNGNLYVRTVKNDGNAVKNSDLGLDDAFIDSAMSTLGGSTASQTIGDVSSKYGFDIGLVLFGQYRILDWFVRGELSGMFPLYNRTISLMKSSTTDNKSDSKNKSSSNSDDFSLTRQFEFAFTLLGGYNVTQSFAIVAGVGVVCSSFVLNNVNKLYDAYKVNDIYGKISNTTDADLNSWQKDCGNDGNNTKKFLNWALRFKFGFEVNIGKSLILSLRVFGGPKRNIVKSTDKNFGSGTISNMGLEADLFWKI